MRFESQSHAQPGTIVDTGNAFEDAGAFNESAPIQVVFGEAFPCDQAEIRSRRDDEFGADHAGAGLQPGVVQMHRLRLFHCLEVFGCHDLDAVEDDGGRLVGRVAVPEQPASCDPQLLADVVQQFFDRRRPISFAQARPPSDRWQAARGDLWRFRSAGLRASRQCPCQTADRRSGRRRPGRCGRDRLR